MAARLHVSPPDQHLACPLEPAPMNEGGPPTLELDARRRLVLAGY
jgi:hypothetical protein